MIVEQIKKAQVEVDSTALAYLLQLKHVNVTKVFHTEEDIEFWWGFYIYSVYKLTCQ